MACTAYAVYNTVGALHTTYYIYICTIRVTFLKTFWLSSAVISNDVWSLESIVLIVADILQLFLHLTSSPTLLSLTMFHLIGHNWSQLLSSHQHIVSSVLEPSCGGHHWSWSLSTSRLYLLPTYHKRKHQETRVSNTGRCLWCRLSMSCFIFRGVFLVQHCPVSQPGVWHNWCKCRQGSVHHKYRMFRWRWNCCWSMCFRIWR